MRYDLEWDPEKARQNVQKHGVGFEQATSVFRDPGALSLFDDDHSEREERWITLGLAAVGGLLVVHHTFEHVGGGACIRIFSCRKASRREIAQYRERSG